MILLNGYLTFLITELSFVKLSGILCIFIFGIFQSNYNLYNLSPEAQKKIEDILELLAYFSEALIFLFLGISIGDYRFTIINFIWVPCLLFIMVLVRFAVVFMMWPIARVMTPIKDRPEFKDIFLVAMCGNIRGAISFALILILKNSRGENHILDDQIISTIQLTVLSTMFIYTPINSCLINCLLVNCRRPATERVPLGSKQSLFNSILPKTIITKRADNKVVNNTIKGDYEKIELKLDRRTGCKKYMFIINELLLKPSLIYDYKNRQKNEKNSLNCNIQRRFSWKKDFSEMYSKTQSKFYKPKQFKDFKFSDEGIYEKNKIIDNNKN